MKKIRTAYSDTNLAVLKLGENSEHDILMLGHVFEFVEFDNIILSEQGGSDYFLEVLVPEKHMQAIRTLE